MARPADAGWLTAQIHERTRNINPAVANTDHMSAGLLSHQPAERDDRRDAGEEEEDGGRQALHVDSVPQHAEIHPRVVAVLHVVDHASEKSATSPNRMALGRARTSATRPLRCRCRYYATDGAIGVGFRCRPLARAGEVSAAEVTDRKGDNFGSTVTSFYSAR